jgi:triphosphatase
MMREDRELEFKVQLSKAAFDRISRSTKDKNVSRQKLRTIYFDTPQLDLFTAGLFLRLRQQKDRWIQTVKAGQGLKNGLSNPVELENEVSGELPDLGAITDRKYARKIRDVIGKADVKPVFETVVQRTTRRMQLNGSEIELALDAGEVRTDKSRLEIREIELELKQGRAEALLLAAEKLFDGQEITPSSQTKSGRGYELLGARKPEKQPSEKLEIGPKTTCVDAFSALLEEATRHIIENRRLVLETDDRKGPHQMRIGLRRLRSLLKALRPEAEPELLRKFDKIAADVARAIGELRDADALRDSIYRPVADTASDRLGFSELNKALDGHHQSEQDKVRAFLQSPDWSHLQVYLSLWPRTLETADGLKQPLLGHARKLFKKRWKKLRKLGHDLEQLNAEQRHDMRKALKQFRYLSEFFAPIFGKVRQTSSFIKQLKELQDVFGYMNDVHMAAQLPEVLKGQNDMAKLAAQYVLGWHESEARHVWARAGTAWEQLRGSPKFWN